jgi:diguanylate cyclase (GGDEF)-like protein
MISASQTFDPLNTETEQATLTSALYSLLETLPQSYSGRESIKLLCQAVLGASSKLRFVWVGFLEGDAGQVKPHAIVGDGAEETDDWHLPGNCFECAGPYSEAQLESGEISHQAHSLFQPWRANPQSRSVNCALAIPLRSEKPGLRGMIVFYADSIDYFACMGVPVFQAFCHVAEIIWKQSNLMHLATQKAQQDPLTGLMNRRQTMLVLEKQIAQAEQAGEALSILICRVEGFDRLNALYGCMASDAILAAFSKEAIEQMRSRDIVGRWTDVEFLCILPRTGAEEAEMLAKRLRDHFLTRPVNVKNWSVRLALTVGTAIYSKHIIGLDDLILHANQDMLAAADSLPSSIL